MDSYRNGLYAVQAISTTSCGLSPDSSYPQKHLYIHESGHTWSPSCDVNDIINVPTLVVAPNTMKSGNGTSPLWP